MGWRNTFHSLSNYFFPNNLMHLIMKQTISKNSSSNQSSVIILNANNSTTIKSTKGKSRTFTSRVSKQHRCDRIISRISRNIAHYGVTIEIDHALNVCLWGHIEKVNTVSLSKYLKLERIKMKDLLLWDNGEFMLILK